MDNLKEYHYIWLKKHKQTKYWLKEMLMNGFHIHHLDGDHSNNNPNNLLLIYGGDHAQLHSAPIKKFSKRVNNKWVTDEEYKDTVFNTGKEVYKLLKEKTEWDDIVIKFTFTGPTLRKYLNVYCEKTNKKAPSNYNNGRKGANYGKYDFDSMSDNDMKIYKDGLMKYIDTPHSWKFIANKYNISEHKMKQGAKYIYDKLKKPTDPAYIKKWKSSLSKIYNEEIEQALSDI